MHVGVVKFLKQESNRTGHKILMATLVAGLANGLIIVVINEASQNYAALNFRYLIIFALYFHVAGRFLGMDFGDIAGGNAG
jgi:hypothetical protein